MSNAFGFRIGGPARWQRPSAGRAGRVGLCLGWKGPQMSGWAGLKQGRYGYSHRSDLARGGRKKAPLCWRVLSRKRKRGRVFACSASRNGRGRGPGWGAAGPGPTHGESAALIPGAPRKSREPGRFTTRGDPPLGRRGWGADGVSFGERSRQGPPGGAVGGISELATKDRA
jgi:hypothetical protein